MLFFILAAFLSTAHADQDPLLARMEGHWVGHGVRKYAISGRQVQIDADVQTAYQVIGGQNALVSRNQITESAPGAAPRGYTLTYWVRPEGRPGSYALGAMTSTQPTSWGQFLGDGSFQSEQDLGGNPPLDVSSTTRFYPDRTTYDETFRIGSEVQSQTEIEYQRAALNQ